MSFFKQESGMQAMLKSLIPPELYAQILDAAKKVPFIIENVQNTMVSIDARLKTILDNQELILFRLERCEMKLDPSYVPQTALTTLDERVSNGETTGEDLELLRTVPVTQTAADSRLTSDDIALLDKHPPKIIN